MGCDQTLIFFMCVSLCSVLVVFLRRPQITIFPKHPVLFSNHHVFLSVCVVLSHHHKSVVRLYIIYFFVFSVISCLVVGYLFCQIANVRIRIKSMRICSQFKVFFCVID